MENMQFETDGNEFECVECGRKIEVPETKEDSQEVKEKGPEETRNITCPTCGTEYKVGRTRDSMGLNVTVESDSMTELEEVTEKELEQDND